MTAHRIYIDQGAQPVVTVPHRGGHPVRVAGGTYQIVDTRFGIDSPEHQVVPAGTAVVIDATSTVLTNKAGRGAEDRHALTLVSTASLVEGHVYLLESTAGQVELVSIAKVASATSARTSSEIRGDFATGTTLRGIEATAMFPEVEANDDANLDGLPFVIIWSFPGLPPIREAIHAERGEEMQLATLADLQLLDPMISLAGGDRVDPAAALARAHRDLRTDLQVAGIQEADLLSGNIGRDCVVYRAAYLCTQHSDDPASERKAADYKARWDELRAALVLGEKTKPQVTALTTEQAASRFNPTNYFTMFGYDRG